MVKEDTDTPPDPWMISSQNQTYGSDPHSKEVTYKEHLQAVHPPKKGVTKLITNALKKKTRSRRQHTSDEVRSLHDFTVASSDTVKASNTTAQQEDGSGSTTTNQHHHNSPKRVAFRKQWNKIKAALRVDESSRNTSSDRVRSQTVHRMDQSIQGRLDGIDVISLGSAQFNTHLEENDQKECARSKLASVTGQPALLDTAQMIANVLWSSCGRALPEIILECFTPGSRWSVRIEPPVTQQQNQTSMPLEDYCFSLPSFSTHQSNPPSLLQLVSSEDYETSEDGSAVMPTSRLWPTLWGADPAPLIGIAPLERVQADDPLLTLAAEHSIPIDLDENTFCVSERSHLETIHGFVATALGMGRFETAIAIFEKLLKGIDLIKDANILFLRGSVLHNMGMVYCWQGNFVSALELFHSAVAERKQFLPPGHSDIAVSMVREGMAQFALGRFDEALFCMELALPMMPQDSIVASKVLNNIGACNYMKRDFMTALKDFTRSLEIQRQWLEGSVRRDGIIYDTACVLSNMGKLYLHREDCHLAYYVYEEALLLQTTIFRRDHDLVLASLTSLALTRAQSNQTKNSLQILQSCLRSQTPRFGKESRECVDTIGMMGYLYFDLAAYDDALKCLLTVRRWQKANLASDHPASVRTIATLTQIEEKGGKSVSNLWV
jgi:tetratricopeptide (TPR) repeat protein